MAEMQIGNHEIENNSDIFPKDFDFEFRKMTKPIHH